MAFNPPRAKKPKPTKTGPFDAGPTGRYMLCPRSNTKASGHGPVAPQLQQSESGTLWFLCVCGFRGYVAKRQNNDPKIEGFSRDEAIQAGWLAV